MLSTLALGVAPTAARLFDARAVDTVAAVVVAVAARPRAVHVFRDAALEVVLRLPARASAVAIAPVTSRKQPVSVLVLCEGGMLYGVPISSLVRLKYVRARACVWGRCHCTRARLTCVRVAGGVCRIPTCEEHHPTSARRERATISMLSHLQPPVESHCNRAGKVAAIAAGRDRLLLLSRSAASISWRRCHYTMATL